MGGKGYPMTTNPTKNMILWEGISATSEQVNLLWHRRAAFADWSALSVEQRLEYIHAYSEALTKYKDELAELIAQETGKPLWETA